MNQRSPSYWIKGYRWLQIKNFSDLAPSELFDSSVIPNKIEIFEGDDSYAFIMITDSVQPTIQSFDEVTDLAMQETAMKRQISFSMILLTELKKFIRRRNPY